MSVTSILLSVILSTYISRVLAIGMTIPPVVTGDLKRYSSLTNLLNCVSYTTSKDDIIMLTIKSGSKLDSQQLNLRVFDSEDNTLRSLHDMTGEQSIIFTNLNNPVQISQTNSNNRIGLANRRQVNEIQSSSLSGISQIHICFDNVYFDKSWSFQKRPREVHFDISVRNLATLKQTNYNDYAKFFVRIIERVTQAGEEKKNSKPEFTESDFDKAVAHLQTLLYEVSEELKSSEEMLRTLKALEIELRNTNESIYESFTFTFVLLVVTICIFGAGQLMYMYGYLKRRRLL